MINLQLISIRYEGNFFNNYKEGYGKYINIDGYYYIGQWNKDSFNGKGILYTENGSIRYEGEFIKNKFKGN